MGTTKTKKLKHKRTKLAKKSRAVRLKSPVVIPTGQPTVLGQQGHRPKRTWLWIILLVVGLQLVLGTAWYWLYQQTVLSFQTSPSITYKTSIRAPIPLAISIPAARISVPIVPATIKNGIWEISKTTATHLNDSARPGEGGNIVVYGHNLKQIFGNLVQVKKNDIISIKTADHKVYEYTVTDISVVKPEQVESVLPTDYEVLTIYTCTGWLDAKRLVIKAQPSRVSSD